MPGVLLILCVFSWHVCGCSYKSGDFNDGADNFLKSVYFVKIMYTGQECSKTYGRADAHLEHMAHETAS